GPGTAERWVAEFGWCEVFVLKGREGPFCIQGIDLTAGEEKHPQTIIVEIGDAGVSDWLAISWFTAGALDIAEEAVVSIRAMVEGATGEGVPAVDDRRQKEIRIQITVVQAPSHAVGKQGGAGGFRAGIIVGVSEVNIPKSV